MEKYEVIKFKDNEFEMDVNVSPIEETVWLTIEQIALLFERDRSVISRHINNIYNEKELERNTSVHFLHISENHSNPQNRPPEYYNLDVIISVGYRVKSKRGVLFRKWANKVLKDHLIKGYTVNNKRLEYLEKTIRLIDIASKIDNKLQAHEAFE